MYLGDRWLFTAGGMTLVENSDYIVDYAMGVVTILNQSIIEAGTPISISLEKSIDVQYAT